MDLHFNASAQALSVLDLSQALIDLNNISSFSGPSPSSSVFRFTSLANERSRPAVRIQADLVLHSRCDIVCDSATKPQGERDDNVHVHSESGFHPSEGHGV